MWESEAANLKYNHADLAFLRLLRECYFHPSRDTEFPSVEMKHLTWAAVLLLWEKDVIILFGKTYGRKEIHRVMLRRMAPEDLDAAVNFFVHSEELTTVDHLSELIFASMIHGGTLSEIQFGRDFGGAA